MDKLLDITSVGIPLLTVGTIVSLVWYMRSWLERQFSHLKTMIFDKLDELNDKLQYHERHDDQRFHDISDNLNKRFNETYNDIWAIKVRNATIDGQTRAEEKAAAGHN